MNITTESGETPESITVNGVQYVRCEVELNEHEQRTLGEAKALRKIATLSFLSVPQVAWLRYRDYPQCVMPD